MKEDRLFPRGYRGCIFLVVALALAVSVTAATVSYQRPSRLFCGGRLSAGFPLPFVCDATGESPLSSVGQIDWADADSVSFPGSFLDILFYMILSWLAWLGLRGLVQMAGQRQKSR